jgi:uncharacterized membrane protein YjjB (DUF3815 family)
MPFFAAFFVSLPISFCYKYDVVDESAGLLMVPALFVFIPGNNITMQAVELIEGKWMAGVARFSYAIIMLVLLVAGGYLAATIAGLSVDELDPVSNEPDFEWWAIYIGRVFYALGVGFAFQMALKHFPINFIITEIVAVVTQGFTYLLGEYVGTFLGSLAMTIIAMYVSKFPKQPPSYVYIATPFFTLTPGSHGLRGFEAVASGDEITGYEDFWSLIFLLIVIALGIVGGSIISRGFGFGVRGGG